MNAISRNVLSLDAPFWFDHLNKLVNMRHGMTKPVQKEGK